MTSAMTPLRLLGHLLLWTGFFTGSFLAVRNAEVAGDKWATIQWPWYAIALFVGICGVVVLRLTQRQATTHAHKLEDDLATINDSMQHLKRKLTDLKKQKESVHVGSVLHFIDDELMPHVADFVDARESMIHTFGMQQYADVMTDFAAGERNINRAWSASADGYIDEVWASIDRADDKMQAVCEKLASFKSETFGD
jgi:hypothetical protein